MGKVLPEWMKRQHREMELHLWKVRTEKELDTWLWPMTDLPLFGCQQVNQGWNFHNYEYIDIYMYNSNSKKTKPIKWIKINMGGHHGIPQSKQKIYLQTLIKDTGLSFPNSDTFQISLVSISPDSTPSPGKWGSRTWISLGRMWPKKWCAAPIKQLMADQHEFCLGTL